MVAYLLFARGQLLLLHRPVTLYSFRQKFCVCVFALKLQWWWFMTCQMISSFCMVLQAAQYVRLTPENE
jgi:hypothetical protein